MACVIAFYGFLNISMAASGVGVYYLIDPVSGGGGGVIPVENQSHVDLSLPPSFAIKDLAFNMVPANLVTSFFKRYQTKMEGNETNVRYIGEQADTPNILGRQY